MGVIAETDFDDLGWDRSFLWASSCLTEPFCFGYEMLRYRMVAPLTPNVLDNCDTVAKELAFRALIGVGTIGCAGVMGANLPLSLGMIGTLGVGSRVLRGIGFALQKNNFTHVRGDLPEKDVTDTGILIREWNICGPGGGFPYDHGGVRVWRNRVDAIVEALKNSEEGFPDVLVFNEIYDTALAEVLIARLKSEYAHIYCHLGATVLGSVGGCMVFTKCAVYDASNTTFNDSDWTLKRGFFTLEVKKNKEAKEACARIIGTHLIHGNEEKDRDRRKMEVDQIIASLAKKTLDLPTVLAGDLNIEQDSVEDFDCFEGKLIHGYSGWEPTCTNRLRDEIWYGKPAWAVEPPETIDDVGIFEKDVPGCAYGTLEESSVIKAFGNGCKEEFPLSDHHSIGAWLILDHS